MNRRERRLAAKESRALPRPEPATPSATAAALYEEGVRHLLAGRHLDAQTCCEKALALDAEHADTLHLAGLLCIRTGQHDHAIDWISSAIRREPKADYLANLGTALTSLGRREEALAVFDKAAQIKPGDAASWKNLGDALSRVERVEDAIRSYQHALKLDPGAADIALKAGLLLRDVRRDEEAFACFKLHEKMPSDSALKFQMRALASFTLEKFAEGLADIERAYALDPTNAGICNNAGMFLVRLGRVDEALAWFDRALGLRPDFVDALNNQAFALNYLHRFTEALAAYNKITTLRTNNARAIFGASLLHLLTGNYEAGWAGREVRCRVPGLSIARFEFSQPRWLGKEPIDGKTILIYEDEGSGDTLQFARYIPMLAARGARIILYVGDAVLPLLAKMPGVSQCVSKSVKALPDFDLYCPVCSLPLAFETRLDTIPSGAAYLPGPEAGRLEIWQQRLRDRLGTAKKLRVGLVWSGNPKHLNDRNRSIPLRTLLPLLDADAAFISLQKDPRPDDRAVLEQTGIVDLSQHLADFTETAALIGCLDLVITVDTSVAHLAGGLGRPTWILLHYMPDWRWHLDRQDSPWYPTARLFRQEQREDYDGVVARLRSELDARIAAPR